MLADDSVDTSLVKTELTVNNSANNLQNITLPDLDIDDDTPAITRLFSESSEVDDDMVQINMDDDDVEVNKPTETTTEKTKDADEDKLPSNAEEKDKEKQQKQQQNVVDNEEKEQIESKEPEKDKEEKEAPKTAEEKEMNDKIMQIEECVKLFPKLEEGLDINTKFSDACDFEENPGYRMFSHYGFKIFHGWVVDPKQEELHKLIGNKSYDETIDFLVSDPAKDATEEEKKQLEDDKDIVRKFFAESATQLTSYGLERLYLLMDKEDELAIFFRNNHFSTIVKHADILYEFVTDEGIVDADPQITWQTLLQISGDEQFVNNKFNAIQNNMSQYSQIAQYNRMKAQTENNGAAVDGMDDNKESMDESNDALIGIFNSAIDYIDKQSFKKILKEEDEDVDPLVSHGLSDRSSDYFDRFMCKQYVHGLPLINPNFDQKINFNIRSFEKKDARNLLYLMTHSHDENHLHFKNIEFMHADDQFGLILELVGQQINKPKSEHDKEKEDKYPQHIIGCVKYEWTKFNFWDWRESDFEEYDAENVYNMSNNHNSKMEKQRLAKESGVRVDYFVHIIDLCIIKECTKRLLGTQLLKALTYAFPSGTKFGVEVPATNTSAVKCFSKCGFTIARFDQGQGQGGETKYKMTAESNFSYDDYLCFVRNSNVTRPEIINMTNIQSPNSNHLSDEHKAADVNMATVEECDDEHLGDSSPMKPVKSGGDMMDDDIDGTEEYDSEDDPIPEMQQSDIVSNMMYQYPAAIPNSSSFILNMLRSLNLTQHHCVFVEFNIDQEALLHLDASVVEFMINNEADRKKFLKWLAAYKLQQSGDKNKKDATQEPTQEPADDVMEIDDEHAIR